MINPFWNSNERRLRALWRILLQALLFFFFTGLLGYLVIGLAVLIGGISFSDPSFLNNAIIYVQTRPVWRVFSIFSEIASSLAALWLAGRLLDRRRFVDFGFHFNRRWWLDFAFGCTLGALLMAFIFVVELAAGWVEITGFMRNNSSAAVSTWVVLVVAFINFISVAVREEIISRGYHLRNIAEGLNLPCVSPKAALMAGYIISSSMFGLFHLGNPNATVISTINLIVAGFFLGLGFVLTGELAIPIGLHLTWNFFQGNVFGFPVSGGSSRSSIIGVQQLGPDVWTGGAFGPEAGLIGLIAIAIGYALTVLWVRKFHGRAALREDLAVYQHERVGVPTRSPGISSQRDEIA